MLGGQLFLSQNRRLMRLFSASFRYLDYFAVQEASFGVKAS
jgi:hypothetical protein